MSVRHLAVSLVLNEAASYLRLHEELFRITPRILPEDDALLGFCAVLPDYTAQHAEDDVFIFAVVKT